MGTRLLLALAIILAWALAPARPALAQAQRFTTPWGDPDLQGTWNNQTPVPFERPKELGEKAVFTPQEAAEFERTHVKRLVEFIGAVDPTAVREPGRADASDEQNLAIWMDEGKVSPNRRTSLIIEPSDGRIPYTSAGRARWLTVPSLERESLGQPSTADSPQDRPLIERCLAAGGLFEPNPFYNNYHYILQTPDHVVIVMEELHEHRIIPLDRRQHIGPQIRQWLGDSRGHWEGQTLVVETTNFNDRMLFHGATSELRLVERFTRVDVNTIMYRMTVTDQATFTGAWTVENALRKSDAMIYESDCHEGNRGLANILSAARAEEKRKD